MPPPQPPPLLRLCPKHGIVAGRDGRCVICHRSDDDTRSEGGTRRLIGGLLLCVAVVGGVVVWKGGRARPAPAAVVERAIVAPPPPAAVDDEDPPARTPDESLAAAHGAAEQRRQRDLEVEMHRVRVRMFVDDKCELCGAARDFLKEQGLSYTEADVGADPEALAALRKLTPNPTVPSFDVDGEVVVGFGPSSLLGAVRRAADKRTR
jgi:glutaredoxin